MNRTILAFLRPTRIRSQLLALGPLIQACRVPSVEYSPTDRSGILYESIALGSDSIAARRSAPDPQHPDSGIQTDSLVRYPAAGVITLKTGMRSSDWCSAHSQAFHSRRRAASSWSGSETTSRSGLKLCSLSRDKIKP